MTRLFSNTLIISLLLILSAFVGETGTITSKPSAAELSCSQCCSESAPLLPAKHPTVAGQGPNSCALGHAPNSQNNMELIL